MDESTEVTLTNHETGGAFTFADQAKADAFLDRVAAEPEKWEAGPNPDAVPFMGEL